LSDVSARFYLFKKRPMAKRFTDTEKWKKGFIKSLTPEYKLLWLYILDDCDHAGIWHYEPEIAEIRLGCKIDWNEARRIFSDKIHVFDCGDKWFIPAFLDFQYPKFSEEIRACKSAINLLKKYNLLEIYREGNKPFINPLQRVKDTDKDKDKDKGGLGGNDFDPFDDTPYHQKLLNTSIIGDKFKQLVEVHIKPKEVSSFYLAMNAALATTYQRRDRPPRPAQFWPNVAKWLQDETKFQEFKNPPGVVEKLKKSA